MENVTKYIGSGHGDCDIGCILTFKLRGRKAVGTKAFTDVARAANIVAKVNFIGVLIEKTKNWVIVLGTNLHFVIMRSFLCTVVLLLGSSFAYITPTRNISRKQFLIRSAASASLLQGLFSPLPASALPAPEKQKETEVRKGESASSDEA